MKRLLQNRFEFVFSLLILFLPFSKAIPNIIFAILLIMVIIDYKKIIIKDLIFSLKILDFLLMFLMLKSLIFGFFIEDFAYYRFFLIIISISILFLRIKNIRILKQAILLSVNLSLLFSIYKIGVYYVNYKYLPFNDGWAVNKILILERPYAGFFSLISIIISLDLFKTKNVYRGLYILSAIISLFFLFIISARISILSLILIGILYFIFYIKKGIKYKIIMILITITILGSAFLLNQNLAKRFFLKDNYKTSYLIAKNSEPRVVIWSCAKKMVASKEFNDFFGSASYVEIYSKLTSFYGSSIDNIQKRSWFLDQKYNTHNQFLDIYLIGGFICFCVFILFIVSSFYISRNNFFGLSIMITLTLFLMVENLFQRQFGVFIFIIIYCVYFFKREINISQNTII